MASSQNLGATCYANAFIQVTLSSRRFLCVRSHDCRQVWFQDHAFRDGVYRCNPSQEPGKDLEVSCGDFWTEYVLKILLYKDSPIFQLQVTFAALQESTQNVFNPVKLVESLQLRATEQQDAQESVLV